MKLNNNLHIVKKYDNINRTQKVKVCSNRDLHHSNSFDEQKNNIAFI